MPFDRRDRRSVDRIGFKNFATNETLNLRVAIHVQKGNEKDDALARNEVPFPRDRRIEFRGCDSFFESLMKTTEHVDEEISANVLECELHGTLTRDDYAKLVPDIEKIIERYGRIRALVVMHEFHGWDAGALWEAIKWNVKHFRHLERLAVVGEKSVEVRNSSGAFDLSYRHKVRWQRWLTNFYRPFTDAEVRYFTSDELEFARGWVHGVYGEAVTADEDTNIPAQTP